MPLFEGISDDGILADVDATDRAPRGAGLRALAHRHRRVLLRRSRHLPRRGAPRSSAPRSRFYGGGIVNASPPRPAAAHRARPATCRRRGSVSSATSTRASRSTTSRSCAARSAAPTVAAEIVRYPTPSTASTATPATPTTRTPPATPGSGRWTGSPRISVDRPLCARKPLPIWAGGHRTRGGGVRQNRNRCRPTSTPTPPHRPTSTTPARAAGRGAGPAGRRGRSRRRCCGSARSRWSSTSARRGGASRSGTSAGSSMSPALPLGVLLVALDRAPQPRLLAPELRGLAGVPDPRRPGAPGVVHLVPAVGRGVPRRRGHRRRGRRRGARLPAGRGDPHRRAVRAHRGPQLARHRGVGHRPRDRRARRRRARVQLAARARRADERRRQRAARSSASRCCSGYTALRSGSIIPGFLVHLTIDLAALAFFAGALPNTLRVVVDVGALIGLELGLMLAGRRLGLRRRMPRVIDLREPCRSPLPPADRRRRTRDDVAPARRRSSRLRRARHRTRPSRTHRPGRGRARRRRRRPPRRRRRVRRRS